MEFDTPTEIQKKSIPFLLQENRDSKKSWKLFFVMHQNKKNLTFSATMPSEIRRIFKQYMNNPYEVKVSSKNEINRNIIHQYFMVNNQDKREALTRFGGSNSDKRVVVFFVITNTLPSN